MTIQEHLANIEAHDELRAWAKGKATSAEVWDLCERADWLIWWVARGSGWLAVEPVIHRAILRATRDYVPTVLEEANMDVVASWLRGQSADVTFEAVRAEAEKIRGFALIAIEADLADTSEEGRTDRWRGDYSTVKADLALRSLVSLRSAASFAVSASKVIRMARKSLARKSGPYFDEPEPWELSDPCTAAVYAADEVAKTAQLAGFEAVRSREVALQKDDVFALCQCPWTADLNRGRRETRS